MAAACAKLIFSDFLDRVEQGEIQEVTIRENEISGDDLNGKAFQVYVPNDPDLIKTLRKSKVRIDAQPADQSPWYMSILVSWFPLLLFMGVWIYLMRQMQSGGGRAL